MWAGEDLTREQRVLLSTNTSCGWLTGGGRGMNVGDIVRVLPNVRPDRFAGKTGTVCEVNDNEIAVDLGGDVRVWFHLDELEAVLL